MRPTEEKKNLYSEFFRNKVLEPVYDILQKSVEKNQMSTLWRDSFILLVLCDYLNKIQSFPKIEVKQIPVFQKM